MMKNYLIEIEIPLSNCIEKTIIELITIGLKIDLNFQPKKLNINTNYNFQNSFLIKIRGEDNDIKRCKIIPYVKNCWSQFDTIPFNKTA